MAKVARNQERDQEVWRKLEAKGWSVIIVWECQLKKAYFDETVARVTSEIFRNGEIYRTVQEERKKAREEYLRERMERKEREQSLLKEVKSL
jgi:DNA mismatch endonuclease (patch repair protein)